MNHDSDSPPAEVRERLTTQEVQNAGPDETIHTSQVFPNSHWPEDQEQALQFINILGRTSLNEEPVRQEAELP